MAAAVSLGKTGMSANFSNGTYHTDNVYIGAARGDIVVDVSDETPTRPMQLLNVSFHNCHSSDGGAIQFTRNAPQNVSTYADVKFYDSTFIGVTLPLPSWTRSCVVLGSVFTSIVDFGTPANPTAPNVIVGSGNFPAAGRQMAQVGPLVESNGGAPNQGTPATVETTSVETVPVCASPSIAPGHAVTIEAAVTSMEAGTEIGYSSKIAGTFYNASGTLRQQGTSSILYNHGSRRAPAFVIRGDQVRVELSPNNSASTRHQCNLKLNAM
jgi:hypothetical protein